MPYIRGSRSVTGTANANDIGYMDDGILPNITGDFILHNGSSSNYGNGAFYIMETTGRAPAGTVSGTWGYKIGFDASRITNIYNSIYREVQPKRILMYFIIKYI